MQPRPFATRAICSVLIHHLKMWPATKITKNRSAFVIGLAIAELGRLGAGNTCMYRVRSFVCSYALAGSGKRKARRRSRAARSYYPASATSPHTATVITAQYVVSAPRAILSLRKTMNPRRRHSTPHSEPCRQSVPMRG